jgi:hypothetical protein
MTEDDAGGTLGLNVIVASKEDTQPTQGKEQKHSHFGRRPGQALHPT